MVLLQLALQLCAVPITCAAIISSTRGDFEHTLLVLIECATPCNHVYVTGSGGASYYMSGKGGGERSKSVLRLLAERRK
jgi:hypothetical protein